MPNPLAFQSSQHNPISSSLSQQACTTGTAAMVLDFVSPHQVEQEPCFPSPSTKPPTPCHIHGREAITHSHAPGHLPVSQLHLPYRESCRCSSNRRQRQQVLWSAPQGSKHYAERIQRTAHNGVVSRQEATCSHGVFMASNARMGIVSGEHGLPRRLEGRGAPF